MTYDFIIIGSGSSGGMASYILQSGGAKCLLLEAGKRFRREDFPLPEVRYTPQLFWGGGADFTTTAEMAILRGKCVGGGSIVNQALMDRFDQIALDDWRSDSGVEFFTPEDMAPHYEFAESQITLQEIPAEWRNRNQELFIKGMDANGFHWHPLRRAQSNCGSPEGNDCICCLGGCHRGSKQSTMEGYIPRAEAEGLEVQAETQVTHVKHTREGVEVYARQAGREVSYQAKHVVVAGGALGTTEILLRSGYGENYNSLGKKFAMHPQFMNFAVFKEPVNAHRGALQGVASEDPNMRREGYKLENVFAPPIAIATVTKRIGPDLQRLMSKYRHFACIEVAIRDENVGEMFLSKSGRLQIKKRLTAQDESRRAKGFEAIRKVFAVLQPEEIVYGPMGFGLHAMGGCCIGVDGIDSVVNPEFTLHDHPHIHVADISTFPNAPGINPALTVYALTHRMATGLLNN
ncbi:MAG: hypothetical protein RLZZ303_2608 [Candidatus Hydrogenedentota bacterium]